MESGWEATVNSWNSGSHFEERKAAIFNVAETLKQERNIWCLDFLGRGTYGDVLLTYDKKLKIKKAAKVIISKNVIPFEKLIWPKLNHIHILGVEDVLTLTDGTIVYLTALKFKTLHEIILHEGFRLNYGQNFTALRKWLKETLTGVEFLHENGFCHLDLKLDNVMIGHDGIACICDYSSINYCSKPVSVRYIGLADIYQPPESCKNETSDKVNGRAVDLWSYGMLVLEASTDQNILNNVDECQSWVDDIKPALETILDEEEFEWEVKLTFPIHSFTELEFSSLRDFLDLFLQTEPENRKSAKEALIHTFFHDVDIFNIVLSDIYSVEELNTHYVIEDGNEATEERDIDYPRPVVQVRPQLSHITSIRRVKRCFKINKTGGLVKAKRRLRILKEKKCRNKFRTGVFKQALLDATIPAREEAKAESEKEEEEMKVQEQQICQEDIKIQEKQICQEEVKSQVEQICHEESEVQAKQICQEEINSQEKQICQVVSDPPRSTQKKENEGNRLYSEIPNETVVANSDSELAENQNSTESTTICSWLRTKWNALSEIMCPICLCTN